MSCNISAREVLLTLSYSKKGDWDKIYSHIKDKIPLDENKTLKDEEVNLIMKKITDMLAMRFNAEVRS